MGTFFELGKDKAAKREGWAPPFISCAQYTVGLKPPLPLWLLGYGKHLPLPFIKLTSLSNLELKVSNFTKEYLKSQELYLNISATSFSQDIFPVIYLCDFGQNHPSILEIRCRQAILPTPVTLKRGQGHQIFFKISQ